MQALTRTDDLKAGEIWAVALSDDGKYLAGTTFDGRVNVWDTDLLTSSSSATSTSTKETTTSARIQAYESKGSFGTCVDLSSDGELTASGHANGSVHIFNNSTGRLAHSLQGLIKPIRTVSFSPACRYIAAGGDAKVIALYDVKSGEQVANLTCAGWIMGLDWNHSGEYLLSGYVLLDNMSSDTQCDGRLLMTTEDTMAGQRYGVSIVASASPRKRNPTLRSGLSNGFRKVRRRETKHLSRLARAGVSASTERRPGCEMNYAHHQHIGVCDGWMNRQCLVLSKAACIKLGFDLSSPAVWLCLPQSRTLGDIASTCT